MDLIVLQDIGCHWRADGYSWYDPYRDNFKVPSYIGPWWILLCKCNGLEQGEVLQHILKCFHIYRIWTSFGHYVHRPPCISIDSRLQQNLASHSNPCSSKSLATETPEQKANVSTRQHSRETQPNRIKLRKSNV